MSWIFISIFYILLFLVSLCFNCYLLIYLLSKENSDTKPFQIGLAVVVGFILTVIIIKGGLFEKLPISLPIYGAFSGLTYGIYHEGKKSRRKNAKSLATINSETSDNKVSFNIERWFRSTSQLLMFMLLGLAATYSLIRILASLLGKPFFLK